MGSKIIRFFVLAAAASLTGCVSVQNISLDKAQAGPIKTVDLLGVAESKRFMVRSFSGLPALGGLIGGAISGSVQQEQSAKFLGEYNRGKLKFASMMAEDLQRDLAGAGLEVKYLRNESPKAKDGADDYSHISTAADAILNVWYGATGYVAPGAVTSDYEPWLVVNVRMLKGSTKQILYRKTFSGGYQSRLENAVFVPCAAKHRFGDFDALMADFARAIDGLAECQKAIAQRIVADLK